LSSRAAIAVWLSMGAMMPRNQHLALHVTQRAASLECGNDDVAYR
jgi:hypothetical protein